MVMHRRVQQLLELRRSFVPLVRSLTTLSFSQYGEDVLLHSLVPQARGSYVDVGAYHPWRSSNTYRLYLRGWSGITVEPNVDTAALFRRMRPRDTHLTLGVSEKPSKLTYYRFKDPINNTFDAARGAKLKDDLVEEISVDCVPLRDLVSAHCSGTAIDLLSVDCEGLDQEVLASLDWNTTRPTVVIVEDFEQTWAIGRDSAPSALRTFLLDRDYAPVAHSAFSFLYVDVTAFDRHDQPSGFRLDQSQLKGLRRRFPEGMGKATLGKDSAAGVATPERVRR
jgi:FkbM family methyltransferase